MAPYTDLQQESPEYFSYSEIAVEVCAMAWRVPWRPILVSFAEKLGKAMHQGITEAKKRLGADVWAFPRLRKLFLGLGVLAIPVFIAIGFGAQAVNPMTESGHAIVFFTLAATWAALAVVVMEDIRPTKLWAQCLVICALEASILFVLHHSLRWVMRKADEFALVQMIRDAYDSRVIGMEYAWSKQRSASVPNPISATMTAAPLQSYPTNRIQAREPLDVRGEHLCSDILDFAREAQQEEPIGVYGNNISPDVMAAEVLNEKNFRARISTEFDKRFGGALASITKEFGAKGITPDVHMVQPPPSAFEMQLGGKALCSMVYALRQKEGIVDRKLAEKRENYQARGPCLGAPSPDDPFPSERAEQIGIREIDVANTIQNKARDCVRTMMGGGADNDAVRRIFASDIRLCCLENIKKLHYSILSRCPPARDSGGELSYNEFLRDMAPGVNSPACDVDALAKYMRELGQTMKDLTEWRPTFP